MAVAFNWINNSNLTTGNVGVTTVNVGSTNAATTNGSIASGDVLIAVLNASWSSVAISAITAPDGTWTQIYQNANAGNQIIMAAFIKTAGAGESGSYAFTWTGATDRGMSWALIDYGGASGTVDSSQGTFTSESGGNMVAAATSPVGSTDMLIAIWADPGSNQPYGNSGVMNSRVVLQSTSLTFPMLVIADQTLAASGTTGTRTATTSGTSSFHALLITLSPSAAVVIIPPPRRNIIRVSRGFR